jgi:3-methyladenine DNA glycosylase AlkD
MSIIFDNLISEINSLANPKKADDYNRFFKTGLGQYGEGDRFLGISVPIQHKLAGKYNDLSLKDIHDLLESKYHEKRTIALMILKLQYIKADITAKKTYFDFYLAHTNRINNWDLVDMSAPHIIGNFLQTKDRSLLYQLAKSQSLWERRIAIISTFTYIRNNDFKDTLKISKILLTDKHDLIHKAVGWMLREIGKRSQKTLTNFLNSNYKLLPRTALRYSIEKLSPSLRAYYLKLR